MKTTAKSTKADNTKKDTKEEATNNSNYGYTVTKESGKGEDEDQSQDRNDDDHHHEESSMNSDMLTGYKLIETASKMLARKHKSLSRDTWRKEAADLYQHNEGFDGEPVSLSWFITRLENIASFKYGKQSDAKDQEGESDLQSFLQLKKRGLL